MNSAGLTTVWEFNKKRHTQNRIIHRGLMPIQTMFAQQFSMIGSEYEPDFKGKIVYIEDTEEKTYRMDKMLFHLLWATNLKEAAGIVIGVCSECNVNDEPRLTLKNALEDLLHDTGIPVFYGMSFGHIDRKVTIPTGIRATMNADRKTLKLIETPVL